jgi:hypothetical protein
MALNFFGVLLVYLREFVAGVVLRMQEFVELCVNGLRVPMLGALNNQCHEPRCQDRDTAPSKRSSIEDKPKNPVYRYKQEGCWMSRPYTKIGKPTSGGMKSHPNQTPPRDPKFQRGPNAPKAMCNPESRCKSCLNPFLARESA